MQARFMVARVAGAAGGALAATLVELDLGGAGWPGEALGSLKRSGRGFEARLRRLLLTSSEAACGRASLRLCARFCRRKGKRWLWRAQKGTVGGGASPPYAAAFCALRQRVHVGEPLTGGSLGGADVSLHTLRYQTSSCIRTAVHACAAAHMSGTHTSLHSAGRALESGAQADPMAMRVEKGNVSICPCLTTGPSQGGLVCTNPQPACQPRALHAPTMLAPASGGWAALFSASAASQAGGQEASSSRRWLPSAYLTPKKLSAWKHIDFCC